MLSILIAAVFALNSTAQVAEKPEYDEATKKLRAVAANMLRETASELTRLRLAENRISFAAELASLMWLHDEKEARAMFQNAISDLRLMLLQLDQQLAVSDMTGADDGIMGGIFGRYQSSPIERKFRIAMNVRRQIAMSIAEHDGDLAFSFFYDSLAQLSDSALKRETAVSDKYIEAQLLQRIAETDAEKALRYGKQSLKDGFENRHLEVLKRIYAKDVDKGVEYGVDILAKVKQTKIADLDRWLVSSLLDYGDGILEKSSKNKKKPVYSRSDLREIADILARSFLESKEEDEAYAAAIFLEMIEKYSPARAAQIRSKFRNDPALGGTRNAANAVANAMRSAANAAATFANAANSAATVDPREALREQRQAEWESAWENVGKLSNKDLPREQRLAAVDEARRIIERTSSPQAKVTGLTMLAGAVAKTGDKELALQLMNEAERYSNPYPKTYVDYLLAWMLVGGMAEVEPERAFRHLESSIFRLNDTISAAVKIAEFIDLNDEIIEEGELHVGAFGGGMIKELTGELKGATGTLRTLAAADMPKTRALADAFDRPELRFLAKMMILRAVLDDRVIDEDDDEADEQEDESGPPPPPRPRPRSSVR
jgi:hypothetical protein